MLASLIFETVLALVAVLFFCPTILMVRFSCLMSQLPALSIQLI